MCVQLLAIYSDTVSGCHVKCCALNFGPVYINAALLDHPLNVTSTGYACAGDDFGNTVACGCRSGGFIF